MATNTTNYNLKKPATTDPVSIADINGNMDIIDAQIKANADLISSMVPKSGGTMTGALVAQTNTNYTTRQVRNFIMSTSDPTSSDGDNGDFWAVYE